MQKGLILDIHAEMFGLGVGVEESECRIKSSAGRPHSLPHCKLKSLQRPFSFHAVMATCTCPFVRPPVTTRFSSHSDVSDGGPSRLPAKSPPLSLSPSLLVCDRKRFFGETPKPKILNLKRWNFTETVITAVRDIFGRKRHFRPKIVVSAEN